MLNEAKEFSQDSTANKWLNGLSNPVLTLNYDFTPNESFRVESVVVIILGNISLYVILGM